MLRSITAIALVAGLACFAAFASAKDFTQGNLTIENPWARPTDAMAKTSAAYFTVKNKGPADKLIAVSSDVANSTMLHRMMNKDGMMTMQHMEAVMVPANGSAELKPGSFHVMFTGLKSQLKEGATFPMTLTFEKAGKVTVQVAVQRGDGAAEHKHGEMKNDDKGGHKH